MNDNDDNEPIQITPGQFRAALDRLGLGEADASRFLDIEARRIRRWSSDVDRVVPPHWVVLLLAVMIRTGVTAKQAVAIARSIFSPTNKESKP